jgi:hypothetical protein
MSWSNDSVFGLEAMNPIKLHYSEALVRRTVKAYWLRTVGWRAFFIDAVLLAFLIYEAAKGNRSWQIGAVGALFVVMAGLTAAVYVVHYRSSMGRFRLMRTPEAMLELGEERFGVASDFAKSEIAWKAVVEVWRYPDFWLIFYSKAHFNTLPTADLDAAARDYILDRVTAHGGKIS